MNTFYQKKFSGVFLISAILMAPCAYAALGAAPNISTNAKLQVIKKSAITTNSADYSVNTYTTANGGTVREYVSNGTVFGVVWSGARPVNYQELLGFHADTFLNQQSQLTRSRHVAIMQSNDLVVHARGYSGDFHGKAYLTSKIPQGFDLGDLK